MSGTKSNFGANGDIDFNGRVDMRDFFQFGSVFTTRENGVAAVPEPGTLTAMWSLVCAAFSMRVCDGAE